MCAPLEARSNTVSFPIPKINSISLNKIFGATEHSPYTCITSCYDYHLPIDTNWFRKLATLNVFPEIIKEIVVVSLAESKDIMTL